jgi:T-complex protein 1 subunit eta
MNAAIDRIREISVKISEKEEKRDLLIKCAKTSLNSKLISGYKDFFGEMVVEAVSTLD